MFAYLDRRGLDGTGLNKFQQAHLSPFCKFPNPWGKIISDLPQIAAPPPV